MRLSYTEALWLDYLLKNLESKVLIEKPVTIYSDNMVVMAYTKGP